MSFQKLLFNSKRSLEKMNMSSLERVGLERTLETYYLIGFPYPPLLKQKSFDYENEKTIFQRKDLSKNISTPVNLYFHFPFCRVAGKLECSFCHFFKENHNSETEDAIVDAWIKELKLYKSISGNLNVETIYFGGGSVSLIRPKNLLKIVNYLQNEVGVSSSAEVKFEVYADASKDLQHLNDILDIMGNFKNLKIVMDIQSLNPLSLSYVSWKRVNVADYFNTLDVIIKKGFKNICTGLILGLPFETPESFLNGLSQLVVIPEIKALNIYPLMFKRCDHVINFLNNTPELMFDVETRDYVSLASRSLLTSFGFKESPLYFYNRDNNSSVQQVNKYQSERTLIGIGPSAFGFVVDSNVSYYNVPSCKTYLDLLNRNILPIWKYSQLSNQNMAVRSITHGRINMLDQFSIKNIPENIKSDFVNALNIFKKYGLITEHEQGIFSLTDKGILRAEEIAYYLALIDLGPNFINKVNIEQKSPLHFFPGRTEQQILNWNATGK